MARIIGTGSYLPETTYSNEDMEKIVETSDEWIYTRTGIRSRHFSNASENTGDMGYFAAKRALENAGVDASEIDCILVATTTPESLVPNTSSYIQAKLGVPEHPVLISMRHALDSFMDWNWLELFYKWDRKRKFFSSGRRCSLK